MALIIVSFFGCSAFASESERLTRLERAEFVLSGRTTPPGDDAPWTRVDLPHDWRTLEQASRLTGWYRIRFSLAEAPDTTLGVYVRHLRSFALELFVNGIPCITANEIHGPAVLDFNVTLNAPVPKVLWRAGENVIHFRMQASARPRHLHGLARVRIGPYAETSRVARQQFELTGGSVRFTVGATLAAGLISLLLWFAQRRDGVMLWFGIACLSWALSSLPNFFLRPHAPTWLLDMTNAFSRAGLAIPTFIVALRLVNRRWPKVEAALAVFLLLELTFFAWWWRWLPAAVEGHWVMRVSWPTLSALLLCVGVLVIGRWAPRPLRWSNYIEMIALGTMGALLLQDLARYIGWVDLESTVIRHYHVPVMVLAIGLAIFERHVAALWRSNQNRLELERRVAAAAQEIERNHRQVEAARREQTLATERRRMLSDMHDGLGASLVGLLRYVQARPNDAAGIEQRVQEALQEMRIAIDALEPAQGDLATVLGNLRYRLDPLMEASGVRLVWDVPEIPHIDALEPTAVFAIQRAVLEAIFNALKHSGAGEIKVSALPKKDSIDITIADNGLGFDPGQPFAGRGLSTMRSRAQSLGGQADITSRPGEGTRVTFTLPYTIASGATAATQIELSRPTGDTERSAAPA